jgi:hypothetical protein
MITYLGAANIANGSMKWEREIYGVNFVASDSSNKIYFSLPNGVSGYDSNNMPGSLDEKIFYASGSYCGNVVSIGDRKTFFSDTQRVYKIEAL